MKYTRIIILYLVYFITLTSWWEPGSSAASQQQPDRQVSHLVQDGEFNRFWLQFRNCALNAPEQLTILVSSPLILRGELDGEAPKACNSDRLGPAWKTIMNKTVFAVDDHGKMVKITRRKFLQQQATLHRKMIQLAGENRLRVNDFVFIKNDRQWRLEMIYTDLEGVLCPAAP